MSAVIADPGIGRDDAPIGSPDWALRIRLKMQAIVNAVEDKPDALRRYIELARRHRAWTMMHKKDGSFFATFEEFCETRQPWGLGRSWSELKPYVEAVLGKQGADLETVSPSQQGKRTDANTSGHGDPKSTERKDKRLRAILRAPVEVQELYRDGLISQKLAAQLGPKKAEKAKPREEVAAAIKAVPRERKAIDDAVRSLLGQRKPTRVEQAVKLVALMNAAELKKFFEAVEQYRR